MPRLGLSLLATDYSFYLCFQAEGQGWGLLLNLPVLCFGASHSALGQMLLTDNLQTEGA